MTAEPKIATDKDGNKFPFLVEAVQLARFPGDACFAVSFPDTKVIATISLTPQFGIDVKHASHLHYVGIVQFDHLPTEEEAINMAARFPCLFAFKHVLPPEPNQAVMFDVDMEFFKSEHNTEGVWIVPFIMSVPTTPEIIKQNVSLASIAGLAAALIDGVLHSKKPDSTQSMH